MLLIPFLIGLLMGAESPFSNASLGASVFSADTATTIATNADEIPLVPFYSQFQDISKPEWQKLGCGIADLAMLVEYYNPGVVSVDTLLQEGIAAGAYQEGAGWTHRGLVLLARPYGLDGTSYDFAQIDTNTAFAQFKTSLQEGPLIASVHYKLDPQNPIPHLIVVTGIRDNIVYYNDPAETTGGTAISVEDFLNAWKKRFVVVRPYKI